MSKQARVLFFAEWSDRDLRKEIAQSGQRLAATSNISMREAGTSWLLDVLGEYHRRQMQAA